MIATPQKPDFSFEEKHAVNGLVVGVDEVGRGPWAGPVMAAAVWINPELIAFLPEGIKDSKKLTASRRKQIHSELLKKKVGIAVGIAEVIEIDRFNILNASFLAMERALVLLQKKLVYKINTILIDGDKRPKFETFAKKKEIINIVRGDNISLSIAAASIVAKETRDSYMTELHLRYPQYGFDKHKGYGTKAHRAALNEFGPTRHHRFSFNPIKSINLQNSNFK